MLSQPLLFLHHIAMDQPNRLDRMIMRLTAQRNCLSQALELVAAVPGPFLEFGLGKGRTYDFLRSRVNGRRIVAFDRDVHCPADCVPADGDLLLGEFRDTVPGALARIGEAAALLHFDIGGEDPALDSALAAWLSTAADPLVRAGGVVVSDRAMANPRWRALPPPPGGSDGGHFMYRVEEHP
jgi:hypothetical protein